MKMEVYSVYDRVSKAYSQPFFCAKSPDHILAIRAFSNMVKPGTMLFDNANDYCLEYLGEFDDENGIVYNIDKYTMLCTPQDVIDARSSANNTHDIINNLKGEKNVQN